MAKGKINEQQARELLDVAVATRSTDVQRAIGIFQGLKDTDWKYRDMAKQQYGICLQEMRQYPQAEAVFQSLITSEHTERGIPRAYTLRHLAEVQIAQGKLDAAEVVLKEAIDIFEANREFYNLGLVFQLKAAIETSQGDLAHALERMEDAQRMVQNWSQTSFDGSPRVQQATQVAATT